MGDVEKELQGYLAEHKVEDLLKDIVVKLCLEKPADPLEFVKHYITGLQHAAGSAAHDDDDDHRPPQNVGRRGGVSASVVTEDDAEEYEKKIVPKDVATVKALEKAVAENVLFAGLEKDELNDCLDAMFLVKHHAGDVIINQGDEGDNFYVIEKGSVDVWVAPEGGASAKVGTLGEHRSFGELALMYNQPRAATIKAASDCDLWAIDQDTYRRILMGSTMRKRKQYEGFLEKIELLHDLDKWERLAVADALEPAHFADGETVIKQGEEGNEFFIIVDGEAVFTQEEDGESGEVGRGEPGSYFGELALINPEGKRKATVTAKGQLKCVKMDKERFERVLGPCTEVLRRNAERYQKFHAHAHA